MKLKDKVALVTGASRGIGRAIAVKLAEEGARVAVNYNKSKEAAQEVLREIALVGSRGVPIQADVSSEEGPYFVVRQTIEFLGGIDILVNNAGIYERTPFFDVTVADWNRTMNTNLRGPFFCSQEAARYMNDHGGGKIINVATNTESKDNFGIPYIVAKGGLKALTKSLARTTGRYEISVNAVAPGYTHTDMEMYPRGDPRWEPILKKIPSGRINEPEDVARVVAFLASEDAGNITGHVLYIDGGVNA